MTTNYKSAPAVAEIAKDLIEKFHQHISDYSVRIDYQFSDKISSRGGQPVWGSCKKITGLNAYLASASDPFFAITIPEPIWDCLSPESRIALVDHELCHVGAEYQEKDEEEDAIKLTVNPHDYEEFYAVAKRHGNWRDAHIDAVYALMGKEVELEVPVVEEVVQ